MQENEEVIEVVVLDTEKKIQEFVNAIQNYAKKGNIPVFFRLHPVGTWKAPSEGKPYFEVTGLFPAQLLKKFNPKELQEKGFSIGLRELDHLKIYFLVFIPKEEYNENAFEETEENQKK